MPFDQGHQSRVRARWGGYGAREGNGGHRQANGAQRGRTGLHEATASRDAEKINVQEIRADPYMPIE